MTWWATTAGRLVCQPASLRGLPKYKADACRLFMAGRGDLFLRGETWVSVNGFPEVGPAGIAPRSHSGRASNAGSGRGSVSDADIRSMTTEYSGRTNLDAR